MYQYFDLWHTTWLYFVDSMGTFPYHHHESRSDENPRASHKIHPLSDLKSSWNLGGLKKCSSHSDGTASIRSHPMERCHQCWLLNKSPPSPARAASSPQDRAWSCGSQSALSDFFSFPCPNPTPCSERSRNWFPIDVRPWRWKNAHKWARGHLSAKCLDQVHFRALILTCRWGRREPC